jgi:transposase
MLMTFVLWPRRGRNCTGSRTEPKPYLNDEQWLLIADLFPTEPTTSWGGRPRVPSRPCLEGILWMLRNASRWKDLPERYPSPSTCWRRLKEWTESGAFQKAWKRLLGRLDEFRNLNLDEAFADGTFCPAKQGGDKIGRTKRGKGTKIMLMVDGEGLPIAADIASASKAECQLIDGLIDKKATDQHVPRLIYDKAADSDALRDRLATKRIDLICPHRKNRKRPAKQDRRKLRRYKRRYRVERSISWLQRFRRILVRHEWYSFLFLGFVQLACMYTNLQRF